MQQTNILSKFVVDVLESIKVIGVKYCTDSNALFVLDIAIN